MEAETHSADKFRRPKSSAEILKIVRDTLSGTTETIGTTAISSMKDAITTPLKVTAAVLEMAAFLMPLENYTELIVTIETSFTELNSGIRKIAIETIHDLDLRKQLTGSVNFFHVQCTSAFRCLICRAKLLGDPVLVSRLLLLAESTFPADFKGACNLYKKRFIDEDIATLEDVTEPTIFTNLRESLKVAETVLRNAISWSKFYTFTKDAISNLAAGISASTLHLEPLVALDRRITAHTCFTEDVKIRIVAQIAFSLSAVGSFGEIPTENQLKQLEQLQTSCIDLANSLGCGDALVDSLVSDSYWVSWNSGTSKEACSPFELFTRVDRGLLPLVAALPDLTKTRQVSLPEPKEFIQQMLKTIEQSLASPMDQPTVTPFVLRVLKRPIID